MPTYAELETEEAWRAEYAPPNLKAFGYNIRNHYGLSAGAIGLRGDNNHLRGAHRSRRWILQSRFCTNRSYTVTETPGNRSGGDSNWVVGCDITPGRANLLAMCKRLDTAARGGRIEKVTEWYGNSDGDGRVDGWDNIRNRVATSDPSHDWHLHLTLDRARANDDHTDLFNILTGRDTAGDDDMTPDEFLTILNDDRVRTQMRAIPWQYVGGGIPSGMSTLGVLNAIHTATRPTPPQPTPVEITDEQLVKLADLVVGRLPDLIELLLRRKDTTQ